MDSMDFEAARYVWLFYPFVSALTHFAAPSTACKVRAYMVHCASGTVHRNYPTCPTHARSLFPGPSLNALIELADTLALWSSGSNIEMTASARPQLAAAALATRFCLPHIGEEHTCVLKDTLDLL